MTDYNNKCGTCAYFERNGSTKRGWCHKRKYGEDVVCDPNHPYPVYGMSRFKCHCYDKMQIDEMRVSMATADERVESFAQEHSVTLGKPTPAALSLVGEDNPYFRAIRKAGEKSGITVVDGFRATMPVLVDSASNQTHVLTETNDIDHLVTEGLSCVAEATLILLRTYGLVGKSVCIVGRGHAVKGLAKALLDEDATVTVCHSKTKYLTCKMQDADMVVVAAPIRESFRPRNVSVIVDVSGAFAKDEEKLKSVCEYTRHIGKLTVAVLLERVARWRGK